MHQYKFSINFSINVHKHCYNYAPVHVEWMLECDLDRPQTKAVKIPGAISEYMIFMEIHGVVSKDYIIFTNIHGVVSDYMIL